MILIKEDYSRHHRWFQVVVSWVSPSGRTCHPVGWFQRWQRVVPTWRPGSVSWPWQAPSFQSVTRAPEAGPCGHQPAWHWRLDVGQQQPTHPSALSSPPGHHCTEEAYHVRICYHLFQEATGKTRHLISDNKSILFQKQADTMRHSRNVCVYYTTLSS